MLVPNLEGEREGYEEAVLELTVVALQLARN